MKKQFFKGSFGWMRWSLHSKLKNFTIFLVLFTFLSGAVAFDHIGWIKVNTVLKSIIEKFNKYQKVLPEERIYLHIDKSLYYPGETIWFSAYLRNASDLKPSQISDILYVELISPKGTVMSTLNLVAKKGKAQGDFALQDEISGGLYKIKAYTKWQLNEKSPAFFEKEIQIQKVTIPTLKMKLDFEKKAYSKEDIVNAKIAIKTLTNQNLSNYEIKYVAKVGNKQIDAQSTSTDEEGVAYIRFQLPADLNTNDGLLNVLINYNDQTESISRSIPIVLNNINLAFYPEGGYMVCGYDNKIGFKALNEFGKSADISGTVFNEDGEKITDFSSYQFGMGGFSFKPEFAKKYYAVITTPKGIDKKYFLPEGLPKGYIMSLEKQNSSGIDLKIYSPNNEELSVLAQVRGKIQYSNSFQSLAGYNTLHIPTAQFPIGTCQITLFDSHGIPRSERMTFVNMNKQLKIKVTTDKEKYQPREKVRMTVSVSDFNGIPMPGNLSLSVVNDQLLSFADDRSGHILSQLLIEQDLNSKVEEASFYFDPKEQKAPQALDYLMLTSGWRRYKWEEVLDTIPPTIGYLAEKSVIAGTVLNDESKPMPNITVKLGTTFTTKTDKEGKFQFKNIDLDKVLNLNLSASGYENYSYDINQYSSDLNIVLYREDYANNRKFNNVPNMVDFNVADIEEGVGGVEMHVEIENVPLEDVKQEQEFEKDQDVKEEVVLEADILVDDLRGKAIVKEKKDILHKDGVIYHRSKEFASPNYEKKQNPEKRTDFRQTIYWNGDLVIDPSGKASVEFYNNDEIGSFRAIAEGIDQTGVPGRGESVFYTQLPLSISMKMPTEILAGDQLQLPLNIKNNTNKILKGKLMVEAPKSFIISDSIPVNQTLKPGESKTVVLKYLVANSSGEDEISVALNCDGFRDAFSQKVKINSQGFPVVSSFSGNSKDAEYNLDVQNLVEGSIRAKFTAFPSAVSDLLKGIEGILQEPYGCFEQTSMSSYPNLMVLEYMKTVNMNDTKLLASAENLLNKGYNRLLTFETSEKGYEWFGSTPSHEALSAYGLMQFNDMKPFIKVDQDMIDRTANWLMSRRDGKGGFKRNPLALDNFGGASEEITNCYIVYSLYEAGYTNMKAELENIFKIASTSKDPYQMALVVNTLFKAGDTKRGNKLLESLIGLQKEDGSWTGLTHSITRSTHQSLAIETTSLVIMAILRSEKVNAKSLMNGVRFLIGTRSGDGAFGSSQGTIMALKALTNYAKFSKKTQENGTIEIYIDKRKVKEISYLAGETKAIEIDSLEEFLAIGKHKIQVQFKGCENPLPYSISVKWNTSMPNSDARCPVSINCKIESNKAKVGETIRLQTTLNNTSIEGLPFTIAIVGIPSGLSPQPWQLKEMQEKKMVDYYEVIGNNVVFYYRQMMPSETKELKLDLKAEISGTYEAAASCAYLYYTNEFKNWTNYGKVTISGN